MRIINGHSSYEEQDIQQMLYTLAGYDYVYRERICDIIKQMGYSYDDTIALMNMVMDPIEYNIDYMYSLDSAVGEEFICIMEQIGMA